MPIEDPGKKPIDTQQRHTPTTPKPIGRAPPPSSSSSSSPRHHKPRHHVPPDCGFILTERIGKGSFATVYKGEWGGDLLPATVGDEKKPPRQEVAIKVVQRSQLKREKRLMDIFEAEMAILKRMKHPHVVHLIDVVQTSSDFNLIMEYCSFGDLSSFIRKKHHLVKKHPEISDIFTRYPSDQPGLHADLVRHFLAQLACSLAFLREHDIVHRDVKPQNLLLRPGASSPEEAKALGYAGNWNLPVVKIADFGFARFLPATSMAETLCGSPLYMAPEILNYEKYNAKADLWSVGAVTYEMVTGKPPFPAANHMELIKKIDEGKDVITFPFDVAPDLQDIIRGLLKKSPSQRISFEEFFERTAWSQTDAESETPSKARIEENSSALLDESGEASTNYSQNNSKLDASSEKSGYSDYLRRHRENDVAVESASPSPESSLSLDHQHEQGQQEQHLNTTSKNNKDPSKDRGEGSENDYVFIEKRTVEVNSLADDLQAPIVPQRRLTNPERKPRRRRLSSIAYGASPTSALAQALLKSSARLFGAKIDVSGGNNVPNAADSLSFQAPLSVALSPPKTGEKQIIDELEQLATIAKVVILYADVKFTQLEADEDLDIDISNLDEDTRQEMGLNSSMRSSESNLYPMPSPSSHIDPYFQLTLAQEALSLHLKALSVLARAMDRASEWWDQHQSKQDLSNASPGINTLVQWIRDKFNECIDRAETERSMIGKLSAELSNDKLSGEADTSAERLLFDRALEMAKAAAVQEMAALSASQDALTEAGATCEMNYGTAVWMLKALLISDKPEDLLGDDDRTMVDTLMAKIANRLAALRRKLSVVQSTSNSRWSPVTGSPNSQHSQRSLKMAGRSPPQYSQLTPP